uniref:F-box domain-containing protein n=2 Tax=Davidia involucrata TaxID=16924 RepID=A0A5B6ZJM5_DAVIN
MDREVEREGVCFRERKKNTVCTTTRAIEEEEELAEDRLSNLPDALIHHIFSFIDTKFTVQTCVLSKRFKDLWTSLPNLNFDTHHFSRFPLFTKFVSQVLSRRDSSTVSTLNFSRSNFVEPRLMKLVINYAIRHNVRQLNIMVSSRRELPSIALLFNCKSLTNLKLYFGEYQNVPNSLNLPAIITLHLRGVSFSNDKSKCLELFSNCLNLKNLTLIDCCTRGLDVFTIYSHQLVNLTIGY